MMDFGHGFVHCVKVLIEKGRLPVEFVFFFWKALLQQDAPNRMSCLKVLFVGCPAGKTSTAGRSANAMHRVGQHVPFETGNNPFSAVGLVSCATNDTFVYQNSHMFRFM